MSDFPTPGPAIVPHAHRAHRTGARRIRHVALWLATFVTLAYAGGLVWNPIDAEPSGVWELLSPSIVARAVVAGLPYATAVMSILMAHEFGHYFACRVHGIPATLPFFIPGIPPVGTFGALIRIRARFPDRNALFDVAVAGPLAGFVPIVPLLAFGLATSRPGDVPLDEMQGGLLLGEPLAATLLQWLRGGADGGVWQANAAYGAAWVGALVTSLNLFPVGQLDGGHMTYAFSRRLHRLAARLTLWLLPAIMLYQLAVDRQPPGYLIWFVVLLVMRDRHPPLLDEYRPLSRGRRRLAILVVLVFVLCFIPFPFRVID